MPRYVLTPVFHASLSLRRRYPVASQLSRLWPPHSHWCRRCCCCCCCWGFVSSISCRLLRSTHPLNEAGRKWRQIFSEYLILMRAKFVCSRVGSTPSLRLSVNGAVPYALTQPATPLLAARHERWIHASPNRDFGSLLLSQRIHRVK